MAEKTEEPTPKKLEEAREKGNVAQSRDLSSVAVYVAGVALIGVVAGRTASAFTGLWRDAVTSVARGDALLEVTPGFLARAQEEVLLAVAPLLAAAALAGLGAGFGQVGLVISAEPMKPDLKKLNPLSKLKQWFGAKGLVEVAKSMIKIGAVLGVGYLAVRARLPELLRLPLAGPTAVAAVTPSILRPFLWAVAGISAVLAIGDFLFQRWQWKKGLRMSKDDVKQEYKNSEGDPEVKGQRKAIHQEMLHDVGQAVKGSAAVVVNPTHVAVAVEYEQGGDSAPRVVAKGREGLARQIKELAKRHRVPVVRNVPLARALVEVERGDQVPAELYEAVAEVLLFVWRLRDGEAGR
ncbi:MAG: EscU/YscU/HrcU family type III secretion system export apparatus switch protein [Acidobacteriota bacterium]